MTALLAAWGWMWCLPLHVIALLLLPFYGPQGVELRGGKLEIRVARALGHPGGQTLGMVTFYVADPDAWPGDGLRIHENRHTAQAQIFGATLLVLYPLASLLAVCQGQDFHDGNLFELDAYKQSGVR